MVSPIDAVEIAFDLDEWLLFGLVWASVSLGCSSLSLSESECIECYVNCRIIHPGFKDLSVNPIDDCSVWLSPYDLALAED